MYSNYNFYFRFPKKINIKIIFEYFSHFIITVNFVITKNNFFMFIENELENEKESYFIKLKINKNNFIEYYIDEDYLIKNNNFISFKLNIYEILNNLKFSKEFDLLLYYTKSCNLYIASCFNNNIKTKSFLQENPIKLKFFNNKILFQNINDDEFIKIESKNFINNKSIFNNFTDEFLILNFTKNNNLIISDKNEKNIFSIDYINVNNININKRIDFLKKYMIGLNKIINISNFIFVKIDNEYIIFKLQLNIIPNFNLGYIYTYFKF